MILCDLRDLNGDRRTGIRSLPVLLGEKRTRTLLAALLTIVTALTLTMLAHAPARHALASRFADLVTPLALGALLFATRTPRSERFYEWAVEGLLFVPAFAVIVAGR
jgi:4-hydroxybenzoate polyprenyltransferase